ncbi:MAG: AmmeMemoRadiSam system protein A [Ignavibacteriaceae bacterium]|nr:AmmeMemoRadiSam system protein A [Ignavibacteriaceae bacterium]
MFSIKEQEILLEIARKSIEAFLEKGHNKSLFNFDDFENFHKKLGAFTTLTIEGELRGCIGFISSDEPLYRTIQETAILAASEDTRFKPLTIDELPNVDIEISVLGKAEPVNSYDEIILGKDGLIINEGYRRGLLLPQVPVEHNMDKEEYLTAICRKAGLDGSLWKRKKINLQKFKAYHFSESELKYHGK